MRASPNLTPRNPFRDPITTHQQTTLDGLERSPPLMAKRVGGAPGPNLRDFLVCNKSVKNAPSSSSSKSETGQLCLQLVDHSLHPTKLGFHVRRRRSWNVGRCCRLGPERLQSGFYRDQSCHLLCTFGLQLSKLLFLLGNLGVLGCQPLPEALDVIHRSINLIF